jgi:hypothetical protein
VKDTQHINKKIAKFNSKSPTRSKRALLSDSASGEESAEESDFQEQLR